MPKLLHPLLLLILLAALASPAQADDPTPWIETNPDGSVAFLAAPSGSHLSPAAPRPSEDPDLEPGFPVKTHHDIGSFVAWEALFTLVGNIDADPQLEILVSGLAQGPLYAWNYDGSLVPGWPVHYYYAAYYPALGHLSADSPGLDVFAGQYVIRAGSSPPGPLLAFDGSGQMLPGWPRDSACTIPAPGTLADLDGDGLDEILIYEGFCDDHLHAYRANGDPFGFWPVISGQEGNVLGDLDRDGDLEVVAIRERYNNLSTFWAYYYNGLQYDDFNATLNELYRRPVPAIGDVDGDGSLEIVVMGDVGYMPCILSAIVLSSTGEMKQALHTTQDYIGNCVGAAVAPALADMDGDGIPEIIVTQSEMVHVWKGDGTELPGWPITWKAHPEYSDVISPVVGDVDGDGYPDIVFVVKRQVRVYDRFGNMHPHFPKDLDIGYGAIPAIADLDLDGRNEIIITGNDWDGDAGEFDKVWVYDLGGGPHGKIEWGQRGGSPRHWGLYPPPPDEPGIDLGLDAPQSVGIPMSDTVAIPLEYGNIGANTAASVTLTATLGVGLTYVSDTTGVVPEINSNTVVWHLPLACYGYRRAFTLTVSPSAGAAYGDEYLVTLTLGASQPDLTPEDNTAVIVVRVVRRTFLPVVAR